MLVPGGNRVYPTRLWACALTAFNPLDEIQQIPEPVLPIKNHRVVP
jgi:hypothetical protein